jgi:eukaryotic-like serine/threonine-protein kinase
MTSQGHDHVVAPAPEQKSFGKYRLIASLGHGGMAKVYLALHAGLAGFHKLLVIKVLREELMVGSPEGMRMFLGEARLAARLNHPNIVQTHEVGEHQGRCFMAMEYLDGQPYSALIARSREQPLPWAEHLLIVADIARALHYVHTLQSYTGDSLEAVHRDVSPHNVFVTYDGQVKLLDFGIATTVDPEHVTRVGVIQGKLDYIAPEQLRGEATDGRADVFALGVVLWEVLAQQRFAGGHQVADAIKVQNRLTAGERKLHEVAPNVAPELASIVDTATALDPAARFVSAAAFADAIDAYLEGKRERPNAQSLARMMTALFADERTRTRALIDEQLKRVKHSEPPSGETAHMLPTLSQRDASVVSRLFARSSSSELRAASLSSYAVVASPSVTALPVQTRRTLRTALALAAAVMMGAAATLLWPHRQVEPLIGTNIAPSSAAAVATQAHVVATSAPVRAQPIAVEEHASIALDVAIAPAHARLTVDGVSVPAPFSGRFRRDGELHRLEAALEGHRTIRQFVSFERDQRLELELTPIPPSAAVRRAVGKREPSSPNDTAGAAPLPALHPAAPEAKAQLVSGADLGVVQPALFADDLELANPYRGDR